MIDLHSDAVFRHGLALQRVQQHVLANHHGGQNALVHVLRFRNTHQFALAHHAHAVGDCHDLVQLVGNDDDGHLLFLHNAANDGKKLVRLLRGQHRRRLVKDQHVCAAMQGLQNLHALLKTHADFRHSVVGIDLQAVFLHQLLGDGNGLFEVIEELVPTGLVAQHDVLRHGKGGHQHKVLMHHADAAGNGAAGAEMRNFLPLDKDLAAGGRIQAVENVHQGGLSRTVFAHKRKNLALADVKRHVMICQHAGKLHGNMLEGNDGFALCQVDRLTSAKVMDRIFSCIRYSLL